MKILLTCMLLYCSLVLFSQNTVIDSIAAKKPLKINKAAVMENDFSRVYLKSAFGEAEIKDTSGLFMLHSTQIVSVQYVYTRYKQSEEFRQEKLNKDRLYNLYKILPEAFDENVEWKVIEQTQAEDSASAEKYFHGFIFNITPKFELSFITETDYLDSVLELTEKKMPLTCQNELRNLIFKKSLPAPPSFGTKKQSLRLYLSENIQFPEVNSKPVRKAHGYVQSLVYVAENGEIDSVVSQNYDLKPEFLHEVNNVLNNLPDFKASVFNSGKVQYVYKIKTSFSAKNKRSHKISISVSQPKMLSICPPDTTDITSVDYRDLYIMDTSVISILNRKPEWKDMLVVCDFTGSMSPYAAQLLVWFHLTLNANEERIKYFCFFNDGDSKPDKIKTVGSTGGVYTGEAASFEEIKDLARLTQTGGFGGDIPENNVEALITAIKEFPDAGDIIMIADNFATPRDLKLLSKVDRPVKIILCGTQFGINVEYLNFAKQNGGSIYTMEEDIENLTRLNEGDEIQIDGIIYRIKDGKFVKAESM